jgi:hypothetical protein
MQSETGYYIIDEGVVEREEPKRNFTNWAKSLLYNDADYLIAAYSLSKGLSIASNKHAQRINTNSKIVHWVRNKLAQETERLLPIVKKITEIYKKIMGNEESDEEKDEQE